MDRLRSRQAFLGKAGIRLILRDWQSGSQYSCKDGDKGTRSLSQPHTVPPPKDIWLCSEGVWRGFRVSFFFKKIPIVGRLQLPQLPGGDAGTCHTVSPEIAASPASPSPGTPPRVREGFALCPCPEDPPGPTSRLFSPRSLRLRSTGAEKSGGATGGRCRCLGTDASGSFPAPGPAPASPRMERGRDQQGCPRPQSFLTPACATA